MSTVTHVVRGCLGVSYLCRRFHQAGVLYVGVLTHHRVVMHILAYHFEVFGSYTLER